MALTPVLNYQNNDSTADMNMVNYILAQNNRVFLPDRSPATLITDNGSTGPTDLHINVEPFYIMTNGGMVIQNDAQVNIDLTDSIRWEIILYAEHMAPTAKVELFAYDSTTPGTYPPGCSNTAYQTLIAVVDLTVGAPHSSITATEIIYNNADHADVIGRNQFRGYVANFAALPSNVNWNRTGDIYVSIADQQLFYWNGSAPWLPLTDTALATIVATHRANGYTDEKHVTDDIHDGLTGSTDAITSSNPVVSETLLYAELLSTLNTVIDRSDTCQISQRFQVCNNDSLTCHFFLTNNMVARNKEIELYLYGYRIDRFQYEAVGVHNHGLTTSASGSSHTHSVTINADAGGLHAHTVNTQHSHLLLWDIGANENSLYGDAASTSNVIKYADLSNTYSGTEAILKTTTDGLPGAVTSNSPTHQHLVSGNTGSGSVNHVHSGPTDNTGTVSNAATATYGYFDDMQVAIDGTDITANLLTQSGWAKLGDGSPIHPIVAAGYRFLLRDIMITNGDYNGNNTHSITFTLPTSTAGTLEALLRI